MTKLYKVSPLEKNSAQHFIHLCKKTSKGQIKAWKVTETYRRGEGYRELDEPVTESEAKSKIVCDPMIGPGADLRDGSTVDFEYNDSVTKKERIQIEKEWDEVDGDGLSGSAHLLNNFEHGWEIEEESIIILGPVRIDIVDVNDNGDVTIVESNVDPLKYDGDMDAPELVGNKTHPSSALAAVIGEGPTTEAEVISKLWNYIKINGLKDENNPRFINADANLLPVFGKAQVTLFELKEIVNKHLV